MEPLSTTRSRQTSVLSLVVIVSSLGYFVDIYDLLLFTIIRIRSLNDLGITGDAQQTVGLSLLNFQMVGLLVGGILWGILGDKKGRLSVLFGSILLYSLGNIGNGLIHGPHVIFWYKFFRLIVGLGLAGELGAGVTLVSELLPADKRGYGTTIVASVGILGAVAAYFVAQIIPSWRVCYFVGGGLGLLLLILRVGVLESGMYKAIQHLPVSKGNYLAFFTNANRFFRYLTVILLGLPAWYVVGILIAFSDGFAKTLQIQGTPDPGKAVMISYTILTLGGLACGYLSQLLKSRKKALYIFYIICFLAVVAYFRAYHVSLATFYLICGLLGLGVGFWSVFVTVAAEQFGTNLRATAAITAPNYARGALPLITLLYHFLEKQVFQSNVLGAFWTGVICIGLAFLSALWLKETYGKDLNFVEKI